MRTAGLRLCLILAGWLLAAAAHAAPAPVAQDVLKPLAGDDPDARIAAVAQIALGADAAALNVLQALQDERLLQLADGSIVVQQGELPEGAQPLTMNNRLRAAVADALSAMQLFSPERNARLAAAREMRDSGRAAPLALVSKALNAEREADIAAVLRGVEARLKLEDREPLVRRAALKILASSATAALRPQLLAMTEKAADGSWTEPDVAVRSEAVRTLAALDTRIARAEYLGNIFYGISLGSVLLLAALGLAITFGLMGIINMAHGELLMIGAYTTYLCQGAFRAWFPASLDAYLLAAVPAAFLATAAVGIAMERLVIRHLYGRPLETLLATWGISLMLMQAVRSLFGAQNVEVANPSWMSGGFALMDGLVLSWNRIVIVGFALAVLALVWLVLNKTRLGLFVRAVTQNRRMAGCVGVSTGRIDMLTFGLGAGIAGLGGVALSQLGNVGPDLGQGYIVDSFLVVVLGGVGQLAGTVLAAFGLGELSKFLEPVSGAVMAKILILAFIVGFIQKRPQGLFAMKGRSAE